MESVVVGITKTLGALGNQPADVLNDGTGKVIGVTVVGESIVAHHAPPARNAFPPREKKTRRATIPPPEDAPQQRPTDEPVDVTVAIGNAAPHAWENIIAERARRLELAPVPPQSLSAWFGSHGEDALIMDKWDEWRLAHAAVAQFFELATHPHPTPSDAEKYPRGRIGDAICIPVRLVRSNHIPAWRLPRTITRTHTGSLRFLETLDRNIPVARMLAVWLHTITSLYHLIVCVVPRHSSSDAVLSDAHIAHLEVYYTPMTLAHCYALSAVVSAAAIPSAGASPTLPLFGALRAQVDRAASTSSTFVFSIQPPTEHVVPDPPPIADTNWHTILRTEAAHAFTYENKDGERFGMWAQMHRGAPGPVLNVVSVPHDTHAFDVHFTAQMQSPYLPHRVFPMAIPLETMPLAKSPEPITMQLESFSADFASASIATGTETVRYKVCNGALMNATYQFAAPAWVTASYVIPTPECDGTKKVYFVDVRLHVAEPVLGVFMAQSLAHMASAREAEVDDAASDADYNVLFTRAILFHNVCE